MGTRMLGQYYHRWLGKEISVAITQAQRGHEERIYTCLLWSEHFHSAPHITQHTVNSYSAKTTQSSPNTSEPSTCTRDIMLSDSCTLHLTSGVNQGVARIEVLPAHRSRTPDAATILHGEGIPHHAKCTQSV